MFNREVFGPFPAELGPTYHDPIAAYRKLHFMLDGVPEQYIRDSKSPDVQVSFPAKEKLLEATRFAFSLIPFDPATGAGAQDTDCWAVLNTFLTWIDKKKVTTAT